MSEFTHLRTATQTYGEALDYDALHRWSIENRADFWSQLWDFCEVIGDKGRRVLVDGDKMPGGRWFPDARLNFAQNLLRKRPEDEISLVFRGEGQATRTLSFRELRKQVAAFAA